MQSDIFTHDQLIELAKYPQDILQRAVATLANKTVNNPFTWVRKICQDEMAKRTDNEAQPQFAQPYQKFPSRGKSGASLNNAKATTVPRAQVHAQQQLQKERYQQFMDARAQKQNDRLIELGYDPETLHPWERTDILNRDRMSYYTGEDCSNQNTNKTEPAAASITYKETDLEFAVNYEKAIHKRTLENPDFAAKCAKFDRNPLWDRFNSEERANIWMQAHDDCTCRKNEHAGLILPEIAQKINVNPESQSEPTWNDIQESINILNVDDPSLFEEVF